MKRLTGLFFLLLFSFSYGQFPMHYNLGTEKGLQRRQVANDKAPIGNFVSEIAYNGKVYLATSRGLSITDSLLTQWTEYGKDVFNGRPALTTVELANDGTVWVATAFDTAISNDNLSAGGGLYFLRPGETNWVYIPQPVDDPIRFDSTRIDLPTTTNIQNVSYDIAIHGAEVWIASWGGAVRKSTDNGLTWQVVSTNGRRINVLNFLEHRGFSLLSQQDTMWVGTAGGVSKITPMDTTLYTYNAGGNSISGNWVIGLYEQPRTGWVWAITVKALGENEYTSVSATPDGGNTWLNFLAPEFLNGDFPRDIDFYGDTILVAAEGGLYYSLNQGADWQKMGLVVDEETGDPLLNNIFYSVAHWKNRVERNIWFGTSEGLVQTNDLQTYRVYRRFITSEERPQDAVFAYPNPYSPEHGERLRIQFPVTENVRVKIQIFNAAMEKVFETVENKTALTGHTDQSIIWDGKSFANRTVSNGLYFYKCMINGKTYWGKIVVIN